MKLHLDTLLSLTTTFTSMIGLCTRCTGVHWLCELPNSGYVQCCRDFSSIGAAVALIPLTRPHPALRRPVSMTLGVCGEAVDHRQDQRFEGQGCTLWMQQACERFSYAVRVHPSRSSAQARRCCSMADCILVGSGEGQANLCTPEACAHLTCWGASMHPVLKERIDVARAC